MNNMLFLSFIVTCPDPPPSLDNGDYTLSSSNIVGSIATYRCNEGYRFNTTATSHTCQPNEMWSMEDIQCEKGWKIILLVCSVAIPSNQDSEILTPQYTGYPNVILYTFPSLDSDTSLHLKSVHNTFVPRNMYMKNMLFLSSLVTCPDPPPSLDNGDYTLSSNNIVGSIATYTCNEGYRFSTTATSRTCQLNEMWSMEDIQCQKGWKNSFTCQYLHTVYLSPLIKTLKEGTPQ